MSAHISPQTLQEILRERFPSVIVRCDLDPDAGENAFDVFGIPDEDVGGFMEFRIETLPGILRSRKLPAVSLVPHALSDTHYYPEIAREIGSAKKAQKRRPHSSPGRAEPSKGRRPARL